MLPAITESLSRWATKISYLKYASQTQDLWSGFEEPTIVGETGWDHTYFEPGTGNLAMCHNALGTNLTNGLSMTPFWWADGVTLERAAERSASCGGLSPGQVGIAAFGERTAFELRKSRARRYRKSNMVGRS